MKTPINDPLECIIADALTAAGVKHQHESGGKTATLGLDFRVGDVMIECAAFHTPRKIEQMSRHPDIILIQGRRAAELFAKLITK
jgi:hypothetical protein